MRNIRMRVLAVAVEVLACSCYSQVSKIVDSTKPEPFGSMMSPLSKAGA